MHKKSSLGAVRRRMTFANVTSGLALFIALGGTGYAAATLPDDSVGTNQILYHGVTNTDIAPDAVRAWQISKDAVGSSEIRPSAVKAWEIATDAVGPSEIRKNAVGTGELADGSVESADLSTATKAAFTLGRAAVTKAGAAAGGNAKGVAPGTTPGTYTITFDRDVSACQYSATLAAVKAGTTATDTPEPGSVTVAPGGTNTQVDVKTFAEDASHALSAAPQPFHLLVSC